MWAQDFLEFFAEKRLEPEICDASGAKERVDRSPSKSEIFGIDLLSALPSTVTRPEIRLDSLETRSAR